MNTSKNRRAHIIGICGRASSGIAKLLMDKGWQVTGSDQGAYPPITDYLDSLGITYYDSYQASHITDDINLVVVAGNALHVNAQNPEYLRALELQIPVMSYPEILKQYMVKPQSIVVAGTYGKTTITALLTKIFSLAGRDPSYMIGDISLDFPESLHVSESAISIIEGDEHPTLGYSTLPKFAYYQPTHLVLTSMEWDHFNIYHTESDYQQVFINLVRNIPDSGLLVAHKLLKHIPQLQEAIHCNIVWYGSGESYRATEIAYHENGKNACTIVTPHSSFTVDTALFGKHNIENIVAATALALEFGISTEDIQTAIREFKGLKRRLELKYSSEHCLVFHDQGQLPVKVQATIEALRERFPQHYLVAVYDTHASVLHHPETLQKLENTFSAADHVIIPKMVIRNSGEGQRVTGKQLQEAVSKTHSQVQYLPLDDQLIKALADLSVQQSQLLIIFLTTGNIRGLIHHTIEAIKP